MRNALHHSNTVLGHMWYRPEDWEILATMDPEYPIHHRFIFRALRNVRCDGYDLEFEEGGEIDCYEVFKNGPDILRKAFDLAGLEEVSSWTALSGTFRNSSMSIPSKFRLT